MANTVNFGIDLGTTNSLIVKYENGEVIIFRNPKGHKDTLPSVVTFRNERIIVGDKAREFIGRDTQNTFSHFKRKMGTSDKYYVPSLEREVTPIELSAQVLKELKNFVHTGENISDVVITIPASFDTVQSNATKQAGLDAGFEGIYLLQEPIAACLAYFNSNRQKDREEGLWLVYDLGGGTFDVALVRLKEGELKVIDHEGNNYLGGLDFDIAIVKKLIVPHLKSAGKFLNMEEELQSGSGKHNALFFKLLYIAEEAKIALSSQDSAEIEFEATDDEGKVLDMYFTIARVDFERIISEHIAETIDHMREIIERNELSAGDIHEVLLVGGSTYIPAVKDKITTELNIPVNASTDPTVAVALGAGYYAGSKHILKSSVKEVTPEAQSTESNDNDAISMKLAYQKVSQEEEEYFAARIDGDTIGMFYRIQRDDGGFDSGLKTLSSSISEIIPLVKNSANYFTLKVFNDRNDCVYTAPAIEIVQGKFGIAGQPLPEDICIELDDTEELNTRQEVIFAKNSILPLRKTLIKEVTRTIKKNSDDSLIINILEGSHTSNPLSNKPIGIIEISGKNLERDVTRRSDVEITLEMSESRDLKVTAYVAMSDQEFTDVFNPTERYVNGKKLVEEIQQLRNDIRNEINLAENGEHYEILAQLTSQEEEANHLFAEISRLREKDVTDLKYQLQDRKRKLNIAFENATRDRKVAGVAHEYFEMKHTIETLLEKPENEADKPKFERLISSEKQLMKSGNHRLIRRRTAELNKLRFDMEWRQPQYVIFIFYQFKKLEYPDKVEAQKLIDSGNEALERKNYDELQAVINMLSGMLPEKKKPENFRGTGIG